MANVWIEKYEHNAFLGGGSYYEVHYILANGFHGREVFDDYSNALRFKKGIEKDIDETGKIRW